MTSHDEYSSDEEELFEEGVQRSVVDLGFVDVAISEENGDIPTIEDTFIGGKPVWFSEDSKPDEQMVTCSNCQNKMALLLQAFAPLENEFYDRIIYVFGCKNTRQCSKKKGSIKAIRAINKDPIKIAQLKAQQEQHNKILLEEKLQQETKQKLKIEMTNNLFSQDKTSNSFDQNKSENPFEKSNPFKTGNPFDKPSKSKEKEKEEEKKLSFAEIVTKSIPKPTKSTKLNLSLDLPSYPGSFLYVKKEKLKKIQFEPELEKYKHLIDNTENDEDEKVVSGGSSGGLDPKTAKISNMLDDKYFENFSNTVKHNPGQVLRYDIGGKPLLYSGRDDVAKLFMGNESSVPKPGYNPSSVRQFELQLMPKVIMDLEQIDKDNVQVSDILNGMSWGTIIVCTDAQDFMPKFDENHIGYIEEYCGVQWEESV
jgi:pre-rRNA-processing protein TSR4